MKQEYKIGGWVRCIAEAKSHKDLPHNKFKLGKYYQIKNICGDNIETIDGFILCTKYSTIYNIECEWVGMEKPSTYTSERSGNPTKPWEAEAIRRFPIGTKFKCDARNLTAVVTEHTFNTSHDHIIKFNNCEGYVMYCGKWATKIEEPKEKEEGKEEEWIPQVGDWVEILQCKPGQNWSREMNDYVGRILQIEAKNTSDSFTLKDGGGWDWNYKKNPHFKKSRIGKAISISTVGGEVKKEEPKEESLVGGWVRMNRQYRGYKVGEFAQIHDKNSLLFENLYDIETKDGGPPTRVFVGPEDEATYVGKSIPIQQKEEKSTPTYKVGDTVLLSDTAYGWGALPEEANGKIVEILEIDGKYVKFINSDRKRGTTILQEIVKKVSPIITGTPGDMRKKHNVEKLPSEIIVKRKEKVGKKFILS